MKRLVLICLFFCLTACGSKPLISDKVGLQLTSGIGFTAGQIVTGAIVGAAILLIYDPLSPNWEIEEARLSEDTYRLDMRMKRYNTGGAGESLQILRRRAVQLQQERGYGGYELLSYSEGIDSKTLGAQRVAEGTIRLIQPPPPSGNKG